MKKTTEMKRDNIQNVRTCFYEQASWTKNALAQVTGLSLGALTNIIKEMISQGEIRYVEDLMSTGGRRSKLYRRNPDYRHIGMIIAAKMGQQESLKMLISDLDHHLLMCESVLCSQVTMADVLHVIAHMMTDTLMTTLVISIPGVSIDGTCVLCDLSMLQDVAMKSAIQEIFKGDIIIENDVNVACIGLTQSYKERHIAYLYQPVSDYIGCGMVIDGKLYNGASHYAGELRFSPLYSHDVQDQLRESHPQQLLRGFVGMLCAVMNPELIGLCSDCFTLSHGSDFTDMLPAGMRPQVVIRTDIGTDIENGLFSIGYQTVKEKNEYE